LTKELIVEFYEPEKEEFPRIYYMLLVQLVIRDLGSQHESKYDQQAQYKIFVINK
jgi:hypothetical protein